MDELTGRVATSSFVHRVARDAAVLAAVQQQATWLGNYLADHGYLLVRPMGGLSWRGATGPLPALEFPFARALGRITGIDVASRVDFPHAMELAGHWRQLAGVVTA